MNKPLLHFTCKFDLNTLENINPQFSKVETWILYHGDNPNNSNIEKEVIEKALYTLNNIPIVGEYKGETEENPNGMGTHGGKIEITDEGITYYETTMPYGVVPESNNARWELGEDGKEYLVTDTLLWTGRYPDLVATLENGANQSMEIEVIEGYDNDGIFVITEFVFSALCLLGQDVQPCFDCAKVLKANVFQLRFGKMLESIRSDKELDEKKFSLTNTQFRDELRTAVGAIKVTDEWGYTYSRYWYVDHKENEVYVEDAEDNWNICGMAFTTNGDTVTVDFSSAKRKKIEYVDFENGEEPLDEEGSFLFAKHVANVVNHALETKTLEFEKLAKDYFTTEQKYNALNKEVGELQEMRKQDLIALFEKNIGHDERFLALARDSANYTYGILQTEFKVILADTVLAGNKFALHNKKDGGNVVEELPEGSARKSKYGKFN